MTERKSTRSNGGEAIGVLFAAAILGGGLLPVAGLWLGLAWRAFRWTAGW